MRHGGLAIEIEIVGRATKRASAASRAGILYLNSAACDQMKADRSLRRQFSAHPQAPAAPAAAPDQPSRARGQPIFGAVEVAFAHDVGRWQIVFHPQQKQSLRRRSAPGRAAIGGRQHFAGPASSRTPRPTSTSVPTIERTML